MKLVRSVPKIRRRVSESQREMTGSVAIDIVLGLSFIFLLYSLLATIIQEMVARWLGLRPRMLLKAVARMLDDSSPDKAKTRFQNYFYDQHRNLTVFLKDAYQSRPITKLFYEHPSIKYLGESSWSSKPSYLKSSTFSQVLLDILRNPLKSNSFDASKDPMEDVRNTLVNNSLHFADKSDTLYQLKLFAADANGDVTKFKALLEKWFDETMDRCAGWFKKQTQLMLLVIGFGLACGFNVDTLGIVKILSSDPKARQQLVDLTAASYQNLNPKQIIGADTIPKLQEAFVQVNKTISASNSIMGLGWEDDCFRALYQSNGGSMFLGWLITALAISLGAPFWFDILNKVMMLRASRKPEESSATSNPSDLPSSVTNRIG